MLLESSQKVVLICENGLQVDFISCSMHTRFPRRFFCEELKFFLPSYQTRSITPNKSRVQKKTDIIYTSNEKKRSKKSIRLVHRPSGRGVPTMQSPPCRLERRWLMMAGSSCKSVIPLATNCDVESKQVARATHMLLQRSVRLF